MFNQYISREALSVIAVFIFLILFGLINAFRPSVIYNKDLSFRRFGIDIKTKPLSLFGYSRLCWLFWYMLL